MSSKTRKNTLCVLPIVPRVFSFIERYIQYANDEGCYTPKPNALLFGVLLTDA